MSELCHSFLLIFSCLHLLVSHGNHFVGYPLYLHLFGQIDSFNPCFSLFPFFSLFDFLENSIHITFHVGADERIALLGAIQSLFEGSMYTFVFLWTPALSPNDEEIPHGFIFATFMLASMLGSSFASRLLAHSSLRVESYMQIVFIISSASLLIPIVTNVSSGLF